MTNRNITARSSTYAGKIGDVQFVAGVGTADDATNAGKAVIEFAKRQGWAVSGGIATAIVETVAQGKPVAKWTGPEMKTYLDAWHVEYPSNASDDELRKAVLTAFETRAQGGSAALPAAGHTQGTFPVEGAPNVPGDNDAIADAWHTPLTGAALNVDTFPTITTQPANASRVAPATAAFTVAASGTPTPSVQWQKQEKGVGEFVDIAGATALTYTTPATNVANDNGDKFRAVLQNTDGEVTSAVATLTVTSA